MKDNEMEILATFVHGTLSAFHGLGVLYNLKRGNKLDAIIHAGAFAYDILSTVSHARATQTDNCDKDDTV